MEILKQIIYLLWGMSMTVLVIFAILFGAFKLAEYLNKNDEPEKNDNKKS